MGFQETGRLAKEGSRAGKMHVEASAPSLAALPFQFTLWHFQSLRKMCFSCYCDGLRRKGLELTLPHV